MLASRRGAQTRSRDLRWALLFVGFFVYLLLLTWERVEMGEHAREIESLEETLQMERNDEAMHLVDLEDRTGFVAVRDAILNREMLAAGVDQRILLFENRPGPLDVPSDGTFQFAARWFWQGLTGEVAEAQSSAREGGDVEEAR